MSMDRCVSMLHRHYIWQRHLQLYNRSCSGLFWGYRLSSLCEFWHLRVYSDVQMCLWHKHMYGVTSENSYYHYEFLLTFCFTVLNLDENNTATNRHASCIPDGNARQWILIETIQVLLWLGKIKASLYVFSLLHFVFIRHICSVGNLQLHTSASALLV